MASSLDDHEQSSVFSMPQSSPLIGGSHSLVSNTIKMSLHDRCVIISMRVFETMTAYAPLINICNKESSLISRTPKYHERLYEVCISVRSKKN